MKSLLFILLAGYAARSDENNYYVIRMPDDPPIQTKKPFKVYWNVPTMQCSSKKIHFENLYEKFGIIQNDNDRFKGEKVTILYDPGLFPALFKNETSGKFRFRNGGVPQEGDLDKHLDAFKKDLDLSVPDRAFSGIGIIDFESWRPVYRQNFGELKPYKDVSYEIERKMHWWWQKAWIEAEAKRRFEEAAQIFMKTTLTVAKQLRPNALWGFYGFPYCFNMASNNMVEECASGVPEENDQIHWLWSESTALYPSVYSSAKLSTSQLTSLIRGRIREAARCANGRDILPYFWYRYRDASFLSETDLNMALSTLYQSNASGFIVWGSSNDVNTVTKCQKLLNYVENVFGPAIAKYTKQTNKLNDENDIASTTQSSNNVSSTQNPMFNDSSNLNTIKEDIDRGPSLDSQGNDKNLTEQEIYTIFTQPTTENGENAVLQNNSVLINLILSTVLNNVDNTSTNSTELNSKNKKKDVQNVVELLNSSQDINIQINTDASQSTSVVVTNYPLLNEIHSTSSQKSQLLEFTTSSESSVFDETTTSESSKMYKQTKIQTAHTDKNHNYLETTTKEFTTEILPVSDIYNTTVNEYDDDYFFNFDTFGDDFTTQSTTDEIDINLGTKSSKSHESTHNIATLRNEFLDSEITTIYYLENDVNKFKVTENPLVEFSDLSSEKSYIDSSNSKEDSQVMTNFTPSIITTLSMFTDRMIHITEEPTSLQTTINENYFGNELTIVKNEVLVPTESINHYDSESLILTTKSDLIRNKSQVLKTVNDDIFSTDVPVNPNIQTTVVLKLPNVSKDIEVEKGTIFTQTEESNTTKEYRTQSNMSFIESDTTKRQEETYETSFIKSEESIAINDLDYLNGTLFVDLTELNTTKEPKETYKASFLDSDGPESTETPKNFSRIAFEVPVGSTITKDLEVPNRTRLTKSEVTKSTKKLDVSNSTNFVELEKAKFLKEVPMDTTFVDTDESKTTIETEDTTTSIVPTITSTEQVVVN